MKCKQYSGSSAENPIEIFQIPEEYVPSFNFYSQYIPNSYSNSPYYPLYNSPPINSPTNDEILIPSSRGSSSESEISIRMMQPTILHRRIGANSLKQEDHLLKPNNLKRKFSEIEENDEVWPLFLGSFVIKSSCPLLKPQDMQEFFYSKEEKEIEIYASSIEDSLIKKSNGAYQHKITSYSLKTYVKVDGHYLDEISHFCSEIWSFLLNFGIVFLKASVLEKKIEDFQMIVYFKFDVSLRKTAIMDSFNLDEILFNAISFSHLDEGQNHRKQELIKYCKESLLILFEMLKLKKTKESLLELKKKMNLFKNYAHNFERYPELYVESYNSKYYSLNPQRLYSSQKNTNMNNRKYVLITNHWSQLFDSNENERTRYNLINYSIFREEEEEHKVCGLKPEEHKEFLHFMNSNDFSSQPNPLSLNTPLHEYQKQALTWFLYREQAISENDLYKNLKERSKKLNPFWEEYCLIDSQLIYFNIFTGQISLEFPEGKFLNGGILADEMGLGKTIMALSLIHSHKAEVKPRYTRLISLAEKKKLFMEPQLSQTLIIVPLSILDQWKKEIISHSVEGTIKVGQYYGSSRKIFDFSKFDVILMTYDGLVQEYKNFQKTGKSFLFQETWFRVILDEAHSIKNRKSLRNEACCALKATNRWCLTGTPIQNNLDDLFSLAKFLKVSIFGEEYSWWNSYINNSTDSLGILKQIIGPILLRRTKNSVDEKGEVILQLPSKKMDLIMIEMSPDERKIYENLYEKSREEFLVYLKNGSALKNYTGIFAMIMRLRQCCDHPSLVFRPIENGELETELKSFLLKTGKKAENLKISLDLEKKIVVDNEMTCYQKNSISELIEMIKENKFINCPICLSDMIETSLTKCCHVACYECLKKAIQISGICPICRTALNLNEICKICRYFFFIY